MIPTVEDLVEEAADRAGMGAGAFEPGFTANLRRLLDSCRRTANLPPSGCEVLRKVLLRHVRNRFYLQAYVAQRPEVVGAPLRAAVVVTGLPRTGTSLLHNLLALDRRHRVLHVWEGLHPLPPAPERGTTKEALVRQASTWVERLYELTPVFRSIRALTAEAPEECDSLLQNAFASQHFDDMFDAHDYSTWFNTAELSDEYADYGLQLRVLASGDDTPRPWVLKSPSHLGHLPELMSTLPGALVVHCHRHPLEAVPSYASLVRAVRSPYGEVSPPVVGRQCADRCRITLERAIQARARVPSDDLLDIGYSALVREPFQAVTQVYERLGLQLGGGFEERMKQWLADNPQHKHGAHHYRLDDFGLDAAELQDQFAPYLERFGPALSG
jgi:Sulfotransferase family